MSSLATTKRVCHFGLLVIALCALPACMQKLKVHIPKFADKSALTVSDNTLKKVNRTFYGIFHGGDWYYKGARVANGIVNAYIQIPRKLDMKEHIQQRYLKENICPDEQHLDMWSQLEHVELDVHIYTSSKKKSISARCLNPWRAQHS